LARVDDSYMAERIADLKDIETQVLVALGGAAPVQISNLPQDAILIADELFPSQVAALDRTRVAGFCTAGGGPTSHVAILAASMGAPALVAAGPRVLAIEAGAPLVLDADAGILNIAPSEAEFAAAKAAVAERRGRSVAARAAAHEECRTADGVRVPVYANLGALAEAQSAIALGAEGCGLLRTEFLFQDRETPPSEEEQRTQYRAIAEALGGRPLLIRTLDAGGDKPLAFLPLPREENPALGVRALRASLTRPDLLCAQLAAIASAPPARILLPMVNDAADLDAVRALMRDTNIDAPVGAMIETPAAALLAEQLARDCHFFSIGANDLAQYALAMDRGHPALAGMIDALHPAVLRLIAQACEGAKRGRRPIGLCGAIASDPLAAPLLIGLGVESLSVAPAAIADVKARLRSVRLEECREAARDALALSNAMEVRALARERWGDAP
jgi:phosphoenolpyruvate-protein phosphotransferase